MKTIKYFFLIWLVILVLNQVVIFSSCFAPYCLLAALPHTGVIAFFIIIFYRKQNSAVQDDAKQDEKINTSPRAFNVIRSIKGKFFLEKSFVKDWLEVSEKELEIQRELKADPALRKRHDELKTNWYLDDGEKINDNKPDPEPEVREVASFILPTHFEGTENIEKIKEEIAKIILGHSKFLAETKSELDRDPALMSIFQKNMEENGGGKIFAFLNEAYPKKAVETSEVKRSPEPTEKLFVPVKETANSDSNKARVIDPPLALHAKLRQKMTAGEQKVLEFFDRELPLEWEIYIQPHLNGLRPDFVLLNPNVGIAVFEVKDWNLNAMQYFTKKDQWGHDALWAKKDGKVFCIQDQNPVTKVNRYKKEIFDLYCPRLKKGAGFAAITAGVIFPFAGRQQVHELLKPFLNDGQWAKYRPVSGMEDISTGNIEAVFPEGNRENSAVMSENLAKDLRGWLVEPDFATTQRSPLTLDRNQRALAETRTESGYRRIKGAAGSGKSLVLAARAARLANEGKSVLVATYNITLWHYLRDLIVRDLDAPEKIKNIEFHNFHSWCKKTCSDIGWGNRCDDLWELGNQEDTLNNGLPKLAEEAIMQSGADSLYDAILVDEGQDYLPLWWNVLRKACKPNGEMLLVADATQDIYGTSKAWTDDVMKGAGFSGGWAQLSTSYRLPLDAIDRVRDFAETFLPKDTIDLPQSDQKSLFDRCNLRWVQCKPENGEKTCSDEILSLMHQTGKAGLANADITFLTARMKSGQQVVDRLDEYGIQTVNTFGEDHRRKKMGFYMGDAKIKATTLHSFKGWESRLLVVYVTEAAYTESLALIYTGLTRLKRSEEGSWLTIVCSASKLKNYGETWSHSKGNNSSL